LPGTVEDAPVVGLIAHVDSSPDAPGAGVEPIVHRDYDGGTIDLPRGGSVLDPARMPELMTKAGHDIVTTSGDTLLGADDKAGVAEIMTAVAHLAANPDLPRPTLRICFTPDEVMTSWPAGASTTVPSRGSSIGPPGCARWTIGSTPAPGASGLVSTCAISPMTVAASPLPEAGSVAVT
jgi:di/tripeptidase